MPPSPLTLLLPLPLRPLVLLPLLLRLLLRLPSRRRKSRRSNSVSASKKPAFGLAFFCLREVTQALQGCYDYPHFLWIIMWIQLGRIA
jgi:hypothetical protein